MPENEVDQITRQTAALGHAAASVISAWRRQHPGKTRIPRHVRKQALRRWRGEMNNERMRLIEERRRLRAEIADRITWHRQAALDAWMRPADTPDGFARQQWELAQSRQAIEQQIARAPQLTATERGQAIGALVSAHYATDPSKPARPVWGGPLSGVSALRARLLDRLSRQKLGLLPPPRPTPVSMPQLHPYWTTPQPVPPPAPQPVPPSTSQTVQEPQQRVDRADIERIEARQRHLAEEIAKTHQAIAERDSLRAKVQDLGARYADTQRQYRRIAEDLAARGRELSDVHEELDKIRAERDELRRRIDSVETPTKPTRKTAPEGPAGPERGGRKPAARTRISRKPDTPQAPQTPAENRGAKAGGQAKTPKAPQVPVEAVAPAVVSTTERDGVRTQVIDGAVYLPSTPENPAVIGMVINDRPGGTTGPVIGAVVDNYPSPPEEPSVPDWEWEGFDR